MVGLCKSQLPLTKNNVLTAPLVAQGAKTLKNNNDVDTNFFTDLYKIHD